MAARELEGHEASPRAGVIDSQSVRPFESGGVCGFDVGKRIKGRKRGIITDTLGLMVGLVIRSASVQDRSVQDRDGAPEALRAIRLRQPCLRHLFADGGYAGSKLKEAMSRFGD